MENQATNQANDIEIKEDNNRLGRQNNMKAIAKAKLEKRARDDPCFKERELSFKCLSDNQYNYDECGAYFKNVKNCKKFWGRVVSDRMSKGIEPHLPPPEERDQAKELYYMKIMYGKNGKPPS